jgi:hypothetical protein
MWISPRSLSAWFFLITSRTSYPPDCFVLRSFRPSIQHHISNMFVQKISHCGYRSYGQTVNTVTEYCCAFCDRQGDVSAKFEKKMLENGSFILQKSLPVTDWTISPADSWISITRELHCSLLVFILLYIDFLGDLSSHKQIHMVGRFTQKSDANLSIWTTPLLTVMNWYCCKCMESSSNVCHRN